MQAASTAAVAVLVAACPCAFAAAAPAATERAARVDTVVLTEATAVDPARCACTRCTPPAASAGRRAAARRGDRGAADHPVAGRSRPRPRWPPGRSPASPSSTRWPASAGVESSRRSCAAARRRPSSSRTPCSPAARNCSPSTASRSRPTSRPHGRTPRPPGARPSPSRGTVWRGRCCYRRGGTADRRRRGARTPVARTIPSVLPGDRTGTAPAAAGLVGIRPDELVTGTLERLRSDRRFVAVLGEDLPMDRNDPLSAVDALRLARRTASVIRTNAVLSVATSVAALPFAAARVMDFDARGGRGGDRVGGRSGQRSPDPPIPDYRRVRCSSAPDRGSHGRRAAHDRGVGTATPRHPAVPGREAGPAAPRGAGRLRGPAITPRPWTTSPNAQA